MAALNALPQRETMSAKPQKNKILHHSLNAALLVVIGLNVWWFFLREDPTPPTKPPHPMLEQAAPAFQLPTLSVGKDTNFPTSVTLKEHQGKVVILDFWATYCGPCKRQMPILENLHKTFPEDKVAIVSINMDSLPPKKRKDVVSKYVEENGYTFPIVLDNGSASRAYKITRIPTIAVVGPDGQIHYIQSGVASHKTLTGYIKRLLPSKA